MTKQCDRITNQHNLQRSQQDRGSGKGNGLSMALRNISFELFRFLHASKIYVKENVWTVIVPGCFLLLALTILLWVLVRLFRKLYPPTPAELHRQALQVLQLQPKVANKQRYSKNSSSSPQKNKRQQEKQQQQAVKLLTRALLADPTYRPARLSLAALYMYRMSDATAALGVLLQEQEQDDDSTDENNTDKDDNKSNTLSGDLKGLVFDAQAILAGQEHMVQSELQEDLYLRCSSSIFMSKYESKKSKSNQKSQQYSKDSSRPDGIKRKTQ
jgi:hypothetical protein